MSTTFNAWCETCEEPGPALDRKAGGTALLDPDIWQEFLIEHAYHNICLLTDRRKP